MRPGGRDRPGLGRRVCPAGGGGRGVFGRVDYYPARGGAGPHWYAVWLADGIYVCGAVHCHAAGCGRRPIYHFGLERRGGQRMPDAGLALYFAFRLAAAGAVKCVAMADTAVYRLLGRLRAFAANKGLRTEEHTSEIQSLMRQSYAVFV